ncbi:MAG: hypothetical protein KGN74_12480, partial [Gemmatimonadota bacterium]|nr:hypothetical protein [Gemmatimonadota bacterium]
MRATAHRAAALVLVLAALAAAARGQGPRPARPAVAAAPDSALRILNVGDYGRWKRIASADLSPDGKWATYVYAPNDGDDTLFVKDLDGDRVYTIPVGSQPAFSDDSRWVGYYVSPPERAGRGGRGG